MGHRGPNSHTHPVSAIHAPTPTPTPPYPHQHPPPRQLITPHACMARLADSTLDCPSSFNNSIVTHKNRPPPNQHWGCLPPFNQQGKSGERGNPSPFRFRSGRRTPPLRLCCATSTARKGEGCDRLRRYSGSPPRVEPPMDGSPPCSASPRYPLGRVRVASDQPQWLVHSRQHAESPALQTSTAHRQAGGTSHATGPPKRTR